MRPSRPLPDLVERLRADLGDASDPTMERQWPERARALREYVATAGREPVESYEAIRDLLQAHWKVAVIETDKQVPELEQLGGAERSLGRCGVRLLDLMGRADIQIVVRRDQRRAEGQMLRTLLHELGHFAYHFELLQSVSTVYQRVCRCSSR